MEPIKLCKDCKWRNGTYVIPSEFWNCEYPAVQKSPSLVDGTRPPAYCDIQRSSMGKCGSDGKYFELKAT